MLMEERQKKLDLKEENVRVLRKIAIHPNSDAFVPAG